MLAGACQRGSVVPLLLDAGADLNTSDQARPALSQERQGGCTLQARSQERQGGCALPARRPNGNPAHPLPTRQEGVPPLFYACGNSDINTVKHLLDAGALVDRGATAAQLPIHFAAQAGSLPVLEALAAHGASMVVPDADGERGFPHACTLLLVLTPFAAAVRRAWRRLVHTRSCCAARFVTLLSGRLHALALCLQVWAEGGGPVAAGARRACQPGVQGLGRRDATHPSG